MVMVLVFHSFGLIFFCLLTSTGRAGAAGRGGAKDISEYRTSQRFG